MKQFLNFNKLRGKHLLWTKLLRIYCDGGQPKYTLMPRYFRSSYSEYWWLYQAAFIWLGREFNFSFGIDRKGLYR